MKLKRFILGIICALPVALSAQSTHTYLRKADRAYGNEDYTLAEENYRKALEQSSADLKGTYNLGNAIYKQKRMDEAIKHYETAATQAKTVPEKATIQYNIGNTYLKQHNYDKSIAAYRNALRLRPNDGTIKYNLSCAVRMRQQEQKNKQQNAQNKDKKGKPNDGKNGANQPQNQADATAKPDKGEPTAANDKPQNAADAAESMDKQQAREMLKIMDSEERKVQEKVHKTKGVAPKNGKDW